MKPELIEKICKVYNEGQNKFKSVLTHMPYRNAGIRIYEVTEGKSTTLKDRGLFGYCSNEEIHGFLISREFGFFEAYVNYKIKHGWTAGIKAHEMLIVNFALAEDKDKWLEENL